MSHIFISYSRKDLTFAQKIVDALAVNDLDTWVDWKSIPKGEDWEKEIYHGIEEADAFLFLLSPASVVSEMCNKEIAHAVLNGKRILPIVIRDAEVENFLFENAKEEISKRNWIFFREEQDDFEKAIAEIHKTIHTDYEWLKYHTRLQVKALEWERTKDNGQLLRGKVLKDAEQILASTGMLKDPQPTDIQRKFVLRSSIAEGNRRKSITRITVGVSVVVCLLCMLVIAGGGLAFVQSNAKATAQAETTVEAIAKITAQVEAQSQAKISRSSELSTLSQATPLEEPQTALLLAIEANYLADEASKFRLPAAEQALHDALRRAGGIPLLGHTNMVYDVAFSPDGKWLATASAGVDPV